MASHTNAPFTVEQEARIREILGDTTSPEIVYVWANSDGTHGASSKLADALQWGGAYCGFLSVWHGRPSEEVSLVSR